MTTAPEELLTAVVGTGDPVVLVAGSGSGPDSWTTVAEVLAGEFEVWSFVRRAYTGGAPARGAAHVRGGGR